MTEDGNEDYRILIREESERHQMEPMYYLVAQWLCSYEFRRSDPSSTSLPLPGGHADETLMRYALPPERWFDPNQADTPKEEMLAAFEYLRMQLEDLTDEDEEDTRNRILLGRDSVSFRFHGQLIQCGQTRKAHLYLVPLLLYAGESLPPLKVAALDGRRVASNLDLDGLGGGYRLPTPQPIGDRTTTKEIDEAIQLLATEGFREQDPARKVEIKDQIERLLGIREQLVNPLTGNPKNFDTDAQKAFKAVRKGIWYSLVADLKKSYPEFAQHLRESTRFSVSECTYAPDPPEEWTLTRRLRPA